MSRIMQDIFADNPGISKEIYTFCKSIPKYCKAEGEFMAMQQELEEKLGFSQSQRVEECFLRYLGQEVQAYYLFGLGLRQEVLWALGLE